MLTRHLGRILKASAFWSVALLFGFHATAFAGDTQVAPETRSVPILEAETAGDIAVVVRGNGEDKVKFSITNRSTRRLNVVIPPGLVAASQAGQGGLQSMGLGGLASNPGRFGAFRSPPSTRDADRSVPPQPSPPEPEGVAVSAGQTLEFVMPSVCLNYGLPTPTPKNIFKLVSVEQYSSQERVRKALKSLATLGTGQNVAQAVMWHVCNGLSFDQLASQTVRPFNIHELAQAAVFIEALDSSTTGEIVDPASFQQGRIVVRVVGEGSLSKDARRLTGELEGTRVLGLPVRAVEQVDAESARPGTLFLQVVLNSGKPNQTSARVMVRHVSAFGEWISLGQCEIREASAVSNLKGSQLADLVGRSVSRAFVTVTPGRNSPGLTTMKITNRLPMTLAHITLKAGKGDADLVNLDAIGIGPLRTATASVPAPSATVERVELNGL